MGICYSLWKVPGREVGGGGGHTHTRLQVESSVLGGGPRSSASPSVRAAVPACELFFVGLENVWIRAPERAEKNKNKKEKSRIVAIQQI